jgi:dienelactone hydrolase
MSTQPTRLFALTAALLAVSGGVGVRPYVLGLSFVIRAADREGLARRLADLPARAVREREFQIPLSARTVRARAYEPTGAIRRTALLVRGLTPTSYDDPRVVHFARQLAAAGVAVVTPDIPELSRFAITPAITDAIEGAAAWLASDSRLAPDGRIGLMGVSFSGGLALVAAGRPSLRGQLAYVFSFGGYDDLPRVMRYLSTGMVDGHRRVPHDYAVAVVLLVVSERMVPGDQLPELRNAVLRFLRASDLERTDEAGAQREFDALATLAATLPEPARTLLDAVNRHDVTLLGRRMAPYIGEYGRDAALSVARSPKPTAPTFLLHGAEDTVIPAEESTAIAADLRGRASVRLLLTDLISHAEPDRPAHFGDVLRLAAFWGDLLDR